MIIMLSESEIQAECYTLVSPVSAIFRLFPEAHIYAQVDHEKNLFKAVPHLQVIGGSGCIEIGKVQGLFPEALAEPGKVLD